MMAMVSGLVWAQDEKKPDPVKAVREDAVKALKATAAKGGFTFEGEAATEVSQEMGGITVDGFFGGLSGKITGTAAGATAAFKAKNGKALYECWRDKKTVERMTWRGMGQTPGDAANDVLSLVNLEKLAEAAGKAKAGKSLGDAKLGEVACKMLELTLDGESIGKHIEQPEAQGGAVMSMGLKVVRLELKLWIGADGLVHKIEAKVPKTFEGAGIMPGGGEEEEEDEESGEGEMMTSTYTLMLTKLGETKVELPDDIKAMLKE
jgi:hypothetical protein